MSSKFRQPLFKGTQLFPDIFKLSPSMRLLGPGTKTSEGRDRFIETRDKINKFVAAMNQNYYTSDLNTYDVKKYMGNGIYVRYSNQFNQEYVDVWIDAKGETVDKELDPFVFIGVRLLNADACPGSLNLFVWELGTDEILSPTRTDIAVSSQNLSSYIPLTSKYVEVNSKTYSYTSGGMWATTAVATPDTLVGNQRENVVWDQAAVLDYEDRAKVREMSGDVIPVGGYVGVYQVKVNLTADDCEDYAPAECELYVVCGRNASQFQKVYNFTIQRGTSYMYLTFPFGASIPIPPYWVYNADEPPPPDNGPNPHGFNWWQDCVELFSSPKLLVNNVADVTQELTEAILNGTDIQSLSVTSTAIALRSGFIPNTGFEEYSAPDEGVRCPNSNPKWIQCQESRTEERYGWDFFPGAPYKPTTAWSLFSVPNGGRIVIYSRGSQNNLTYIYPFYLVRQVDGIYSEGYYVQDNTVTLSNGTVEEILYDSGTVLPATEPNVNAEIANFPALFNQTYGQNLVASGTFVGGQIISFTMDTFTSHWVSLQIQDSANIDKVDFKGAYSVSGEIQLRSQYETSVKNYCQATGYGARYFYHRVRYDGYVESGTTILASPTDLKADEYQQKYQDIYS